MEFVKSQTIRRINERLVRMRDFVVVNAASGNFDFNRGAEDFFVLLLNKMFQLDLINMNTIKVNFPAIDLGDKRAGVCFQITSDGSSSKLKDTIETFDRHNLSVDFSNLIFLCISTDKPPTAPKHPSVTIESWNIGTLASYLNSLDQNTLSSIEQIFEASLASSLDAQPSLIGGLVSAPKSIGTCTAFLAKLGLKPADKEVPEVLNELQALSDIIGNLTKNEREFLYSIMALGKPPSRGSGFLSAENYILVPVAKVEGRLGRETCFNLFQSLMHENLVDYIDYQPNYDGPVIPSYYIKFYNGSGDFNYFAILWEFLRDDRRLRQLILLNDFSCLD
jgi:hypothetical protein